MRSQRLRVLLPLVLALAVVVAYDLPLLSPHRIGLGTDAILLFYPYEHELARALSRWSLPFWAPGIQSGFPLLAEPQSASLYPPNWVVFGLLPTPLAHDLWLLLHQVLGVLCAYGWGRTLDLTRPAAAVLGLLFGMTTALAGSSVPLVATIAWIPLLFMATERCVRGEHAHSAWPLALIVALQWLGGYPQIALYSMALAALYGIVRLQREHADWPARLRVLSGWLAAVFLGLALASPQLLSTYELSRHSLRADGAPAGLGAEASLFPAALLTFILPSWRSFVTEAGFGFPAYIGLLPFVLAAGTLLAGPRPRAFRPLLAVTLLATLLALGRFGPLFPFVRHLPGFAFFRLPSRWLVFAQFGLLTFFAIAWDAWGKPEASRLEVAARRLLLAAAALLLLNAAVVHPLASLFRAELTQFAEHHVQSSVLTNPFHLQPPAYYHAKIAALYDRLLAATAWSQPTVLIPLVAAAGAWWLWRSPAAGRSGGARLPLAGLILIDVLAAAGWVHSTVAESRVTAAPATVALVRDEVGPCRIYSLTDAGAVTFHSDNLALLPANYHLLFDLPSTGLYSPLGFAPYYRLMERLGGVNLGFGYRPVTPGDVEEGRQLLDFLNVCYVLSREPLAGFALAGEVDGVSVYRNPRRLARAFVVDQAEVTGADDATAVSWMRRHPDRLRDTAVLAEPLPVVLQAGAAAEATVTVGAYAATTATIEVSTPGTVLLVLGDTFYPGWLADVDGRPAPIYRTHAAFRAVVVPPGSHRVRFTYAPTFFRRGVALAAAAAGVLALWAGLLLRRSHAR